MANRTKQTKSKRGSSGRKPATCATPIQSQQSFDRQMMQRAIQLATRGMGRVEPNPMVGCVVTRGRRQIAQGYHRRLGGPHAEIVALRNCESPPRGATVYVTLEPCCHQGKTPPCVDALIEAGVSRVVVAVRDPNPRVKGRGLGKLRRAGIGVQVGVEKESAWELLAPFATLQTLHRPYVIAKWAQGLDGGLVTPSGDSPWISCGTSREFVHRLRARVDAIVVGSNTVCADDPQLTARDVPIRRRATRVVLDSRLRLATGSTLVRTAREVPTIAFTSSHTASSRKADRLTRRGVEVVGVREGKRGLFLADVMRNLADRQMTNVLVEGGPKVLASLFNRKIVDEAFVFVAPRFIGPKVSRNGDGRIGVGLTPRGVEIARSGVDLRYRWRFASIDPG